MGDEQGVGLEGSVEVQQLLEEVRDEVIGGINEGSLPAFPVES